MPKVIKIDSLSPANIDKAIKELKAYQRYVAALPDKILPSILQDAQHTAESGFQQALSVYDSAPGSPNPFDGVEVKHPSKTSWQLVANGSAVAFLEFGAGVHYNGSGSYPRPKPAGVVGIGGYGYHHGLQDSWYLPGGHNLKTWGNPAGMGMAFACDEIISRVVPKAKEAMRHA